MGLVLLATLALPTSPEEVHLLISRPYRPGAAPRACRRPATPLYLPHRPYHATSVSTQAQQQEVQEEEEEAQQGEYAGLGQRGELVRGLGLEQALAGPEELSARLPRLPPEQVRCAAAGVTAKVAVAAAAVV